MFVIILVAECTRSALRVNVIPQPDFAVKVIGQTKIGSQMDKRTATDIDTILSLTSQEDLKWHNNGVTDKSRRQKYIQKTFILDLLQF